MSASPNPLLDTPFPIRFSAIEASHVVPGIRKAIAEARAAADEVASVTGEAKWDNTFAPLIAATDLLGRRVAPVTHLVSVAETTGLRAAYNTVLPEITAFSSEFLLRADLWKRVAACADSEIPPETDPVRRRHMNRTVSDFKRAGAQLGPATKSRVREMHVELARNEQKFAENVLDATMAYELVVTDEDRLTGIPQDALRRAFSRSELSGNRGWTFGLDQPSVEAVVTHAHDRELRRELYIAYATRCRDGKHSNVGLLARILLLRDELASTLGYDDFADYVLENRMAGCGRRATEFEANLVERARPYWASDLALLRERASAEGLDSLQPWDTAYLQEALRREHHDIDDEALRPFLPLPKVLEGLFEIVRRTFGFSVARRSNDDVWHPDVEYYEVSDPEGRVVGAFYADWFPRPEKRQGAWMCDLATGGPRPDGDFEPHLAAVCANLAPPTDDRPALLSHRELRTVFHEFGHLLHHCASTVEIPPRAGINVAWDWVEVPSQLMENWTWEREALDLVSGHYKTGDPIPDELLRGLIGSRRFMGGWSMMRQLAFGSVDLGLHIDMARGLRTVVSELNDDPAYGGPGGPRGAGKSGQAVEGKGEEERHGLDTERGQAIMSYARESFSRHSPRGTFADFHPLASFLHVFAGGYAAGYYSYMWSALLEADAFNRFREDGIFNPEIGRRFVRTILSRGDAAHPGLLFHDFMGRPPDPTALLERELGPEPDRSGVDQPKDPKI